MGEGPPRWVVTKLSTWLSQNCPSLCRPSSLCLFFLHISLLLLPFPFPRPFFLSFSSNAFFSCPFPSPCPLGRTYWPYWHWKFPYNVSEARRPNSRWSPSSLFWRSPIFGCEEGEWRMEEIFFLDPVSPALLCCDNFISLPTLDSFIWMFLKYFHLPQRKKLSLAEHS